MELEKIIVRIEKLLARAEKSKSQNEQQICMQKAHILILEHNIEMSGFKTKNDVYESKTEYFNTSYNKIQIWHSKLIDVIGTNFACLSYLQGYTLCRRVVFLGTKLNATTASLTFTRVCILLYRKRNSYKLGFIDGLNRSYQENFNYYSIVPVVTEETKEKYNEVQKEFEGKLSLDSKQLSHSTTEYTKGYSAGLSFGKKKLENNTYQIEKLSEKFKLQNDERKNDVCQS